MQNELGKLIRHAAVYGVGRILGRAASFLLIPVYTHFFSTQDYGAMEILTLISMIAGIVLAFGLPSSLMRFYYSCRDPKEQNQAIATAMLFSVGVGATIGGLVLIWARPICQFLLGSEQQALLVRLMAVTFFFSYFSDVAWVYLRAQQRSTLYVFLTQASLLGAIVMNLYLVAIQKMGVVGAFWGNAIATGSVGIVLLGLVFREVGVDFSVSHLGVMLRFGAPLVMTWLAAFVLNYSDRFFLQRFTDLANVGMYALAYKFGYVLSLLVVQPFNLMWEPQSYEVAGHENARNIFSRVFVLLSVTLISIAFLMSLFIREIFDLVVGASFYSGYHMVPLIAYAYVIQGIGLFFEAGLLIQKKSRIIAGIGLFCMLICVMLNSVLIFAWGAWGACIATLLSFAAFALITYSYSQKCYPFPCDLKGVAKTAVVSLAVLGAAWVFPGGSLAVRVPLKLAMAVIFFVSVLKLNVLQREEVASLRAIAVRMGHRLGLVRVNDGIPEGLR